MQAAPLPQLKTILGSYSHTKALKNGAITSPLFTLRFEEVEPIHKAFKPMAMHQNADISEMAIITYLQAKSYNKPIFMLPFVVAARFQQGCLIHNAARKPLTLETLRKARIGVRSYSQTTGVWVRAILQNTYNIAPDEIEWITFDPSHIAEYQDPPWSTRAAPGQELLPMLRAGEIDAAILGNDLPNEPGLAPVIPNHMEADRAWYQQHHFVPINHVVVMNQKTAQGFPQSVAEIHKMLRAAKHLAHGAENAIDYLPEYIETLREPLKLMIEICHQQKLLARPLSVDEVFEDFTAFM